MPQIYEGMFLLDNELVRAGWADAKARVTDLLAKHGATVHTARRWAERKLAYPIKKRQRATYLLAYYEIPTEGIHDFVRDLDLSEPILRYLLLKTDAVPKGEAELAAAESSADFAVEAPPPDDAGTYEPVQADLAAQEDSDDSDDSDDSNDSDDDERGARRKKAAPVAVGADGDSDDDEEDAR